MTKNPKIEYASVDDLYLDPNNPRLGRRVASPTLGQDSVLELMRDWTLNELAESFLSSGYWPQEALIVVREKLYGRESLVVIEGNRRLAALKCLNEAVNGRLIGKYWLDLVKNNSIPARLLDKVPYIEVSSREEVAAYLGFRHVTGIKEWQPAEKAEYIAYLIERQNLSYEEVRKKIGSKAPTVRQHYISYRLLLQMEEQESVAIEKVEDKFSVLYLSLRTHGAQKYLHININATPEEAKFPVPEEAKDQLVRFAKWLFGDKKNAPLFTDSRNVDAFGKILASDSGVEYLERTEHPNFELASRKAGVGEDEVVDLVQRASDNVQLSLTDVHVYRKSSELQKAVRRLGVDVAALLKVFPAIKVEILKEMEDDASAA